MNEADGQLGLHQSLNIDKLKLSFHDSSLHQAKPSPARYPRAHTDFAAQLRQPIKITPRRDRRPVGLESVVAVVDNEPQETQEAQVQAEVTTPERADFSNLSVKKKNRTRNTPVYFNNYDYYEKRVTQKEPASEIHNSSSFNDSCDFSSFLHGSTKKKGNINVLLQEFDLQTLVNDAEAFSTIQLPDDLTKIKRLCIMKPVTINGTASSVLEVSESIHIDLSGYPQAYQSVTFSECTIKFECPVIKDILNQSTATKRSKESEELKLSNKKSYSNQINHNFTYNFNRNNEGTMTVESGRMYPLFRVYTNSRLEVRDSNISSKNRNSHSGVNFPDICFFLDYQCFNNTNGIRDLELQPSVHIQSSFISDFYTTVQNNTLGSVYLEKLYISKSQGHAVNISNPYILEMKECTIEDTMKSCINLRFSLDISTELKRRVVLENNKLNKGLNYGISIFGENMKAQLCDVSIIQNQLSFFEKDGIGIKNININKVRIEKNQILSSARNGIFLQNLLDSTTFEQVHLSENKITQSHLYGLVIMDSSCFSEKDEIFQNAKAGILLSGSNKGITREEASFYKKYPLRNIFTASDIYFNKESGITIIGYLKGPIILNSCSIHENTNGIYIKQPSLSPSERGLDTSTSHIQVTDPSCDPSALSSIMLDKCSVFQNELSGIHMKGISVKTYLKETTIYENRNYAIFIQNETDKDNIIFRNGEKGKVRDYISGYVGGSWGVLFEQNFNVCKRANCSIF